MTVNDPGMTPHSQNTGLGPGHVSSHHHTPVGVEHVTEVDLPDKVLYISSTALRNHPELVREAMTQSIRAPVEYRRGGLVILVLIPKM